ncbi:MAG TPA: hypothetical protein VGI69_06305 [Gaiellaceae bacterium]|jgi:hypothetical protein
MTRLSSRFLAAIAVVGAAVAASLVGGVGKGHASTTFDWSFKQLIAAPAHDPVPEVSYGGKIGYELSVTNHDTSNATHVQVVVRAPSATFFDANNPSCVAAKGDSSTMICTPPGGTLRSNDTYGPIDFRFTAPASGPPPPPASVTATPSLTISAQTNGSPNNNGTTLSTGPQAVVNLNADGSVDDTYLRKGEPASAEGPQKFSTKLPDVLLGDPFGLELGIHNQVGKICSTCIGTFTELTIPAASLAGPGTPFGETNPYLWTMTATTATSFKLLGVFHIDDSLNAAPVLIPACATGGPTLVAPLCYDTLTSKNHAGVQTLTASGRGLENGRVGFG